MRKTRPADDGTQDAELRSGESPTLPPDTSITLAQWPRGSVSAQAKTTREHPRGKRTLFADGTTKRFGANLRAARRKAGLGQAEVAYRLGVSKVTLHYWESGKQRPLLHRVEALARAVRVPLEELLDWL